MTTTSAIDIESLLESSDSEDEAQLRTQVSHSSNSVNIDNLLIDSDDDDHEQQHETNDAELSTKNLKDQIGLEIESSIDFLLTPSNVDLNKTTDPLESIVDMEQRSLENFVFCHIPSLESAYRYEISFQKISFKKSRLLAGHDVFDCTLGIRSNLLTEITSQLTKSAQFKHHGPGKAISVFVSEKSILVGTSRGICLIFDSNQELRKVRFYHSKLSDLSCRNYSFILFRLFNRLDPPKIFMHSHQ